MIRYCPDSSPTSTQHETAIITHCLPIKSNSPISKTTKSKFKSKLKKKAFIRTKPPKQVQRSSMAETLLKQTGKKAVQNVPEPSSEQTGEKIWKTY